MSVRPHLQHLRLALSLTCLVALALVAPLARADVMSEYRGTCIQYREALMNVVYELMKGNGEGARSGVDTTVTRWVELQQIAQSEEFVALLGKKRAGAFSRLWRPMLENLEKAGSLLDRPDRPFLRALKEVKKATKRTDRVPGLLTKLPIPGAVLLELGGRSAGFHHPKKRVKLQVLARDNNGERCAGEPQVQVSNLSSATAVDPAPVDLSDDGSFTIVMGQEMGVARVEATVCGAVDSRFLFNRGSSCGDGVLDSDEACEPGLISTGCAATDRCVPAGLARACTCLPRCAVSPLPTGWTLITGTPSGTCGCTVESPTQVDCGSPGSNVRDLGCGDLLIGGGLSALSPGRVPDGARLVTAISLCGGTELIIGPSAGTGPTDCSKGLDAEGDPQCFFGPPLPLPHEVAPISTCIVNAIRTDVTGTVDTASGAQTVYMDLASRVFLTGISLDDPVTPELEVCARCVDGDGNAVTNGAGTCNAGENAGQPCHSINSGGLTADCQPHHTLSVGVLEINLAPLTTATATMTATDGNFCNFGSCAYGVREGEACDSDEDCPQGTCGPRCQGGSADGEPCTADEDCPQGDEIGVCGQASPGAFEGGPTVRRIIETGAAPPAPFVVGDTRAARLGAVFCIPRTDSASVDAVSSLPGPGALSLDVTISLE